MMPVTNYSVLGVLDRAYRGAIEVQFFDALSGVLDFRSMLSHVDLVLRGTAVTLAVDEKDYRPGLRLGSRLIDTLPDYRNSIRELIAEGVKVMVDEHDLRTLHMAPEDLIPGTMCLDTNQLAARWHEYDGIWFV